VSQVHALGRYFTLESTSSGASDTGGYITRRRRVTNAMSPAARADCARRLIAYRPAWITSKNLRIKRNVAKCGRDDSLPALDLRHV